VKQNVQIDVLISLAAALHGIDQNIPIGYTNLK
jgi:hypothetical protein